MTVRIGIDTGGTFTDVVRCTQRGVTVHKLPSTPDDPGRAVLAGIAAVRARPDEPVDVVHGTTVGLNAVLQGRLPRTLFVTNRGFRDLIEIGRQERTDLYALEPDRPAPPVPRELRLEVDCRRGPGGESVQPLRAGAIEALVRRACALRPAAIAIGLLHSPSSPEDERRIARALRRALPGLPITCSAELWPATGEYERFAAAILNAAIAPLVSAYTSRIARELGPGQLRLMRSSIGIVPPREATAFPARAMFSGPAGGVLATERLAAAASLPRAAAFDMGGTSTDVCLVQPGNLHTDQGSIAGLPLPLPTVDVHTVGCGGGSIAFCDRGGLLRVGPQSAGADPGPACYGKGDEPTVTDAHVALGHLGADTLLGGGFRIDVDRSVRAIERLARRVGLSPTKTAHGVLAIADVTMARALMRITGERAVDPASVPLCAYGGAGGLHACGLLQRLGMPLAIVPDHPGAFSALGLALAGESIELEEPRLEPWSSAGERQLRRDAAALARTAAARLPGAARVQTVVRMRYAGQGQSLAIPLRATGLRAAFADRHQQRFGFTASAPVEFVAIAVRAEGRGMRYPLARTRGRSPATAQRRRPPLGGPSLEVFRRSELPAGAHLSGPCVIEETTAATWLPHGFALRAHARGLQLEAARQH